MRLYLDAFWISPYALFAYVALKEKGLEFDVVPVALQSKEQRTPAYLEISLTGKVPCLQDGTFAVTESPAIVGYLEDAYPFPSRPRVLPASPRERARALQIFSWLNSDFAALREERSTATMFYKKAEEPLSPAAERDAERLFAFARRVVPLDGAPLFETWSIADTVLGFMLNRLIQNGDPVSEVLHAYALAQWQRPSVQDFVKVTRAPYVPYY
jgi:glutathione S-transferase